MIEFGGNYYPTKKDFERAYRVEAERFNKNMRSIANDIDMSTYYAQYMAIDLYENNLGFRAWKKMEDARDATDVIYLARLGTSTMSESTLRKTLTQLKLYNQKFEGDNIMSKKHITASADAFMTSLGIKDKRVFKKAMRVFRSTDFASYLIYEIDKTSYKTSISKMAKLIERGYSEEETLSIVNNMFNHQLDYKKAGPPSLSDVEKWLSKTEFMTDEEIAYNWLT